MLIVRVELHSAITGERTEIARMEVDNLGTGTPVRGDYRVRTLRGRSSRALDARHVQREGRVFGHARQAVHVWWLIAKALSAVGYSVPASTPSTPRKDAPAASHAGASANPQPLPAGDRSCL